MDRSPVRYRAAACVIGGGLLMASASGVALADPDGTGGQTDSGSSTASGPQADGPGTATPGAGPPGLGLTPPLRVPGVPSINSPSGITPRQPTAILNGEVLGAPPTEAEPSRPVLPSLREVLPPVPLPDLDAPLVPELQSVLNELGVPTLPGGGLPTLESIFPSTGEAAAVTGGGSAPVTSAAAATPPTQLVPAGQPVIPAPTIASLAPAPAANQPLPPAAPKPAETVTVTPLSQEVEYRAGYSEDLRNAGTGQIASVALPGVGSMLLLIAGGGFFGYRQAKAGHIVRTDGIARFLR